MDTDRKPQRMETPHRIPWRWLFVMAWRDSRRNRSRLFLFISSIVLGIAALVSVYALGENLRAEVDRQAAELLGADMEISGNRPFPPEATALTDSLGDRRSEQKSFPSMAVFPRTGRSRLVQVRALGGEYPYYGRLETTPAEAAAGFRKGGLALADRSLLLQFGASVGDSIRIGSRSFLIHGTLEAAPGQSGFTASVAPVVYIPLQDLAATGLEQKGSRIRYTLFVKYDRPVDVEALSEGLEKRLESAELDLDTVEGRKEQTGRSLTDVSRFLSLTGFIALLMGCIGVAGAIGILIREKTATIAILRCLGSTARQAFLIYLIQLLGIGLLGSAMGAALGTAIQQGLPLLLADLLPVKLQPALSWKAIGMGCGLGIVISALFSLEPLAGVRRISPLQALRAAFQPQAGHDSLALGIRVLTVAFIWAFTALQLGRWLQAAYFTLGVLLAYGLLHMLAKGLMWVARRFAKAGWAYPVRQGVSNLHRPQNQTATLIVALGLGTALLCTVIFIQGILLERVQVSAAENQPNMVLFDIRGAQREDLLRMARAEGLPVTGTVPIVGMRLQAVNGITAARLREDSTIDMRRGVFTREYRVTFRDTLTETERITEGTWTGRWKGGTQPIYISVEEGFARRNRMEIGDTLRFDVQGAPLTTIVGSLRAVEWNRIQTNFLVVFPAGVLEEAPQFHVLVTRVPTLEASARFQQKVVTAFPNVSVVDLGLALDVVDKLLRKVGFVIRFIALFCLLTGLVVLVASVMISRYQRMRESVLLRTLGASRRQVTVISLTEYLALGILSAGAGILLATAGSWALAHFLFEVTFKPDGMAVLWVLVGVSGVTALIGMGNSRMVLDKPPLEVLRAE